MMPAERKTKNCLKKGRAEKTKNCLKKRQSRKNKKQSEKKAEQKNKNRSEKEADLKKRRKSRHAFSRPGDALISGQAPDLTFGIIIHVRAVYV